MPAEASSVQGVRIRLTDERWEHICGQHDELAGLHGALLHTVEAPAVVLEGPAGESLAVAELEADKWLVVVNRIDESRNDGFIITAYSTRRRSALSRWRQIWPQEE